LTSDLDLQSQIKVKSHSIQKLEWTDGSDCITCRGSEVGNNSPKTTTSKTWWSLATVVGCSLETIVVPYELYELYD